MIHYTLKGPAHKLEIHDNKLVLKGKGFFGIFGRTSKTTWDIPQLAQFNITVPKYLFSGKVEWKDFDGNHGSFRFSTNPEMMKKIELYLQKKIIKNHQALQEAQQIFKKTKKARRRTDYKAPRIAA